MLNDRFVVKKVKEDVKEAATHIFSLLLNEKR
jgi:hypothetical protein